METSVAERIPADRIVDALWYAASYLFTNLSVLLGVLLFFVLNSTEVEGRENVPRERNVLVLANHQSMIDSFLVGIAAFYPRTWTRPYLIPRHPAAEENFFKNPFITACSKLWRAFPIQEGRRDFKALYRMTRALREGTMVLFPEGTRSRDGTVGEGRPGAGLVALGTEATVIPAMVTGMDEVLPVGAWIPRFGKEVRVHFGEPIGYDDLRGGPRTRETAQELVNRAMSWIRERKREVEDAGEGAAA